MGTTPIERFLPPDLWPGGEPYTGPPRYGAVPFNNTFFLPIGETLPTLEIITRLGDEIDNDGNYVFEVKTSTHLLLGGGGSRFLSMSYYQHNNARILWYCHQGFFYFCKITDVQMNLVNGDGDVHDYGYASSYLRAVVKKEDYGENRNQEFNEAEMEMIRKYEMEKRGP